MSEERADYIAGEDYSNWRKIRIIYDDGVMEIVYTPTLAELTLSENIRRVEVLR